MRRPLARATAACAASALALSLWAAGPAAGEEAPPEVEGAAAAKKRDASAGYDGEHTKTPSHAPTHSDRARTETEISHWTYVDRAFPAQTYDEAEAASVGTGRLEWDRVYTRRALLRFPIELDPGTVVDSAVLRTEVSWSYDCHSRSHVQLHRVDPFGSGTTWNDQPAEQALLDTREVEGGHTTCPSEDGVEFDATQAYQRAVDDGESHLHLRIKDRDESGTTAWRRFRIADAPPTLVIDHHTPPPGTVATDSPGPRHEKTFEGHTPNPTSSGATQAPDLPTDGAAGFTGTDGPLAPNLVPADQSRTATGRVRSGGRGAVDRPVARRSRRQPDGDTFPRSRGPPGRTVAGDRSDPTGHEKRSTENGPHPRVRPL